MAVKIRLSRIGKKHVPFYRIVAVDERRKRDGVFLENLGTYDVLKSQLIQFHEERLQNWIAKGAIPTDAVKKIHKLYTKTSKNSDATAPAVITVQRPSKKAAVKA